MWSVTKPQYGVCRGRCHFPLRVEEYKTIFEEDLHKNI